MSRVSIIIVGSQPSIAASLMTLSRDKNIQVIACLSDITEVLNKLKHTEPTVVLIDFSLINETNYSMLAELRRTHSKAQVIFVCDDADQVKLLNAFRHGASGYLETKDREVFLAKAIQSVSEGEAWVPRQFVSKIVERITRS